MNRLLNSVRTKLLPIAVSIISVMVFTPYLFAADVKLVWDAVKDKTPTIAGYKIYYGTAPGKYTEFIDVGNVKTYTVKKLKNDVNYYFAVTSYLFSGAESQFSNIASVQKDTDVDGIIDDGDKSGKPGDNTCKGGVTGNCDDNCIGVNNPQQADTDNDGVGDLCDNCVLVYNPDQKDSNISEDDNTALEGIQHYGNSCDPDFDNDGMVSLADFAAWRTYYRQTVPPAPAYMDIDDDGIINLSDHSLIRKYYRNSPGPGLGD